MRRKTMFRRIPSLARRCVQRSIPCSESSWAAPLMRWESPSSFLPVSSFAPSRRFVSYVHDEGLHHQEKSATLPVDGSHTLREMPKFLMDEKYFAKARVNDISLVIERQGESFSPSEISLLIDKMLEKSPKTHQKGDIDKLITNLNKKRKMLVLKSVYLKLHSVNPALVSSYRTTETIARMCMALHDAEVYPLIQPNLQKIRSASSYNRGLYIRFLATMGHLDDALDDYAELPPNYLNQNPSVTSELLTGLYAGGYYKELVNVVDYLLKRSDASPIDGVNYARMITELVKAKSKLGELEEVRKLLDDAFSRRVLFLPLAFSDIIANIETSDVWKKNANARSDDLNRSEVERKAIAEQYNCGIYALRKYKSNALTTSPLLNATVNVEDGRGSIVVNAGTLSLSVFKINLVCILGELPTLFECAETECTGKSVVIFPGLYFEEIKQMMNILYPECDVRDDDNGSLCIDAASVQKYYKDGLFV